VIYLSPDQEKTLKILTFFEGVFKMNHNHSIDWSEEVGTNEMDALFYEGECEICHHKFRQIYTLSGFYEVKQSGQENEEEVFLGDSVPEDCQKGR